MTGKRKTTEEFITEARTKHGDRFDYSLVEYERSDKPVTIICRIHGPFSIQAESHLRRSNSCLLCRGGAKPKPVDKFIEQARKLHGEKKYDYSQVKYEHSQSKVKIICPEHGSFEQRPSDHLRADSRGGCHQCGLISIRNNNLKTKEKFILDAISVHGDRYDYDKIEYIDTQTKVEIVCKKHGSFWQTPNNHFRGNGCSKCSMRVSKNGKKWLDQLSIHTLLREHSLKFNNEKKTRIVDGYDPTTNTVYQFHGTYWHGHPDYHDPFKKHPKRRNATYGDLYKETLRMDQNIRETGFNLVVMWEHDFE